jgi:hypothetical protein
MSDLVNCSNCQRLPQPKEEFINSKNRVCKLCRKCRTKYNKQNSAPENQERIKKWREENIERVRVLSRKAANAWVQREKKKDVKTYNKNIQDTRKKCATVKLNQMKRSAMKRDLIWELSDEYAIELVRTACIYCSYLDLNKTVNSIDRLDSSKNYTVDNCVASCVHCNMMKGCYDPVTFIERCKKIGKCSFMFPNIAICDKPKTYSRKKNIPETNSQFQIQIDRPGPES